MRAAKNQSEAVRNYRVLRAIEARIHADYDRARERGDIPRAMRHANRIYMIESRLWTNAPVGLSTHSDLD
jgi:hypothetical protein